MEEKEILSTFETNGFFKDPISSIVMATMVGMFLMFTFMMVAGVIGGMIGLLGGILLVYGFWAGRARYYLTEKGLGRRMEPFVAKWIKRGVKEQFIPFEHMVSYRADKDLNRGMQEVEFLKIKLKTSPHRIWINNQKNPDGFFEFRDRFIEVVRNRNEKTIKKREEVKSQSVSGTPIVEKKSWYTTLFAKIITWIFILSSLGLLLLYITGDLSRNTQLFRLFYIVIPGTIYMVIRVFRQKNQ